MVLSKPTAKRTLVYFLIRIGVVTPLTAATYMIDAELKSHSLYELMEELEEEIRRGN